MTQKSSTSLFLSSVIQFPGYRQRRRRFLPLKKLSLFRGMCYWWDIIAYRASYNIWKLFEQWLIRVKGRFIPTLNFCKFEAYCGELSSNQNVIALRRKAFVCAIQPSSIFQFVQFLEFSTPEREEPVSTFHGIQRASVIVTSAPFYDLQRAMHPRSVIVKYGFQHSVWRFVVDNLIN